MSRFINTTANLLLLVLVISFSSCKKEEKDLNNSNPTNPPSSSYYISCKVDGVLIEFKDQNTLLGIAGNSGNQHSLLIQGNLVNSISNLNLQVYDSTAIETKGYGGLDLVNNIIVGVIIGYEDDNGMLYATQFTNPIVSSTVTELSSTVCRGTFAGEVEDPISGQKHTITEGMFYVKRIP
jgi:hypothetical protein